MEKLSNRLKKLSDSQTLVMTQKSRELKNKGFDVINLSIGEPDFNTPDPVKEAAKIAIDNNFTHYSPVAGFAGLLAVISTKFKKENNLDYKPNQIVVSNGAKQSIVNILMCIINDDDEVIIPKPYWVSYPEMVKLAGGKPVYLDSSIQTDFKLDPKQLEEKINDKTKAIIFNSPSNPTGSVYSQTELKAIADILAKNKNVYIISDEIYEHINFCGKHESIAQFPEIKERVIVVNGVSKAFAMTGWRIGYIGAPQWIAKECIKLQGQITSGASSIAQKAALAAISSDEPFSKIMCQEFLVRRDNVLKLLNEIPGVKCNVPEGAFYVFPNISSYFNKSFGKYKISNSEDLSMYILETVYVGIVPGSAFGNENCVRISYAVKNEKLVEAISRIKTALAKLK